MPKTKVCRYILILICGVLFSSLPNALQAKEILDLEISFKKHPHIATNFETVVLEKRSKVVIILNDGSQWIVRNTNGDKEFKQISADWRSGDDIRIASRDPGKFKGKFILKNMRNKQVCFADLDPISNDETKSYFIEKIDVNGYAILTQDGSEWAIGWYGACTSYNWEPGERIIINKSTYLNKQDYLLINADRAEVVWASLISWR